MIAMGESALAAQIRNCFETNTPMPSALHDVAMQCYRQYLITKKNTRFQYKLIKKGGRAAEFENAIKKRAGRGGCTLYDRRSE